MSTKPSKSSRGSNVGDTTNEYVCIDLKRVPATHTVTIERDRSVRALIDATHRLQLFTPPHIAQLLCGFAPYRTFWHRIAAGLQHSVALKGDGSLV